MRSAAKAATGLFLWAQGVLARARARAAAARVAAAKAAVLASAVGSALARDDGGPAAMDEGTSGAEQTVWYVVLFFAAAHIADFRFLIFPDAAEGVLHR